MKPSVGEENPNVKTQDLLKFLIPSIFGVHVPCSCPHGDFYYHNWNSFRLFKPKFINILPYVIACITVFAAIINMGLFCQPKSIIENDRLKDISRYAIVSSKSDLGAFFTILVAFNIGPEFITSEIPVQ